jgi:hopanoid biosynthesis associated RND transporter like protein HpnN
MSEQGLARRNTELLSRAIRAWAGLCFARPKLVLAMAGLLVLASLALAAARLDLRMDWTNLFRSDDPVVTNFLAARELFPYPGDIVVLVDGGKEFQRQIYLDILAQRLNAEPTRFFHVFHRWDLQPLRQKALYYLQVEQLVALADGLAQPTSRGWPADIETVVVRELQRTLASRGRERPKVLAAILGQVADPARSETILRLLEEESQLYLTLEGGQTHVLVLKAGTRGAKLDGRGKSIDRLRAILQELTPQATGLRVRLTGLPVLLHDERVTCASDSARAGLLSVGLSSLILLLGFGQLRGPLKAVLATLCGLALSLGYATLAVGHLNFITATVASMLTGLGMDFAIQMLFRFEEECRLGKSPAQAMETTAEATGVDNVLGDLATAVAFGSLALLDFRGVAELGIIVAGGVGLCYLSVLSVLPALLALSQTRHIRPRPSRLVAVESLLLTRSREISVLGLFLFVLALAWAPKVGFQENLLDVQAASLESVRTEKQMIAELGRSALSASVVVENEKQARELVGKLQRLPSVQSATALTSALPSDLELKRPLVERIVAAARTVELPPEVPLQSARDLATLAKAVKAIPRGGVSELEKSRAELSATLQSMGPGPIQDGLGTFQTEVRRDMGLALGFLRTQVATPPSKDDLPEALRIRYLGADGHFLVSVQPSENVWQRAELDRFLGQVATVTPDLVGHPVVQRHILTSFRDSFGRAPWLTICGVCLVMCLTVRHWRDVALSLLPTALGVVGIYGAMGLRGVDFNVVNFVALPICVGIGAVYGVHSLARMAELKSPRLLTSSTGPAILLSGLATFVGFWSLTLSQHQGIASLGWVISVGVAVHLLVSLILLPALVNAIPPLRRSLCGPTRAPD